MIPVLTWFPLKRFRNYCGLIKIARSGFPWETTMKAAVVFPDFLRAALTGGMCGSMAPPSLAGNPGSAHTNCEAAVGSGNG
jgi:hypothetical protein